MSSRLQATTAACGRTGLSICAALASGAAFSGLLLLLDLDRGSASGPRAVCWLALGALVFAVLFPDLARCGAGWLTVRGLLRTRSVRTDQLILVRRGRGPTPLLVLRDSDGRTLDADVTMLVDFPLVWQHVESGIRHSLRTGTLRPGRCDDAAVREIAAAIDAGLGSAILSRAVSEP
ncbi:hypothetical protein G5C51_09040 [Streptomyces sp. A7024]|uniref:Uncharacterized protein n=1 Tax=Streptomyces coryli TaxID=1128680 RepID=A0A6G4TX03_9ACTN|nr:hypothetical protein [Streptomyces coryli]NGN64050.1 hypothetical protein [Streptomyces coryli]